MAQPQLDDAVLDGQTRNNGSCWRCFYWHYSYLAFVFNKPRMYVLSLLHRSPCRPVLAEHDEHLNPYRTPFSGAENTTTSQHIVEYV